jgi:hypothetical protein
MLQVGEADHRTAPNLGPGCLSDPTPVHHHLVALRQRAVFVLRLAREVDRHDTGPVVQDEA